MVNFCGTLASIEKHLSHTKHNRYAYVEISSCGFLIKFHKSAMSGEEKKAKQIYKEYVSFVNELKYS